MKKKVILHGNYTIRLFKGHTVGTIIIEDRKTKTSSRAIVKNNIITPQDKHNLNYHVVNKAIVMYKGW